MVSDSTDKRLVALYGITAAPACGLERKIQELLAFGCRIFGLEIGLLVRIEGQRCTVHNAYSLDDSFRVGDEFPLSHTYWDESIKIDGPLALIRASGTDLENHPCFLRYGIEAYLGIALRQEEGLWGSLSFSGFRPLEADFDDQDKQFLMLMAQWLSGELGRLQQQEALQQLSEWQRAILESATYSIIASDDQGLVISFNRAAEAMLGYRADEVVGRHTPALLHDPEEILARAKSLSEELGEVVLPGFEVFVAKARRGMPEEREWTYIRKDGSRFPVLLSVTPLAGEGGNICGFLGIARDQTQQRKLEEAAAQASRNALSRALLMAIPEAVIGVDARPPHLVRLLNSAAEQLLGIDEGGALNLPLSMLLQEQAEELEAIARPVALSICPGETRETWLLAVARRAPKRFPASFTCTRLALNGGDPDILVLTLRDLTRRQEARQQQRLAETVFEHSAEAIMVTDGQGTILNVNPAFTWLTGYRPDEVIGKTPALLKSGRHDLAFYQAMWASLLQQGHWEGEVWDRHKDGHHFPKWSSINGVRDSQSRITHFIALFSDISERKENEDRIHFLAHHDHLTGLPNRRLLEERAEQLICSSRHGEDRLALILLDLDRFKHVNDALGHQAGDLLLIEMARRLVAAVRASDIVVRLGGDEFVVLLEGAHDVEDINQIVRKIHTSLAAPVQLGHHQAHTPPSMGICRYPEDGGDMATLLRHGDTAMYQVKARGRNGWAFYDPSMDASARARQALEADLHKALAEESFELYFQPQLDTASMQIIGWEALLRWLHPQRGWIAPDEIIALAEESGLIIPLGVWILERACQAAANWQQDGLGIFRVAVNMSARQVAAEDFVATVCRILDETKLTPERLELEINESILMDATPLVRSNLAALKTIGVVLVLDDFGTGYSGLGYLKTFAIDRLKLDRSLIARLHEGGEQAAIVQAVIFMATALQLDVLAEGVETPLQRDVLADLGCRLTQGQLCASPMPGSQISTFLAQVSSLS